MRERQARNHTQESSDWRCNRCGKLLGVCRDGRMHLRFARGHEYLTGFPVEAICCSCTTLNRSAGPSVAASAPRV